MIWRSSLAALLTLVFFSSTFARIRHVPGEYPTIQQGINDCSGGDTLLVEPGEYHENINFNGQYLVLASKLIITGNLAYIDSTIINGNALGPVITFESGEDSRAMVTGFTITNGFSDNGGGIFCDDSGPTISTNLITNNVTYSGLWPYGQGSGIFCDHSNITVINNVFLNNHATGTNGGRGGGICSLFSMPTIINNTFYNNYSQWFGGAFCSIFSTAVITNSIFWGNMADEGPEIYFEDGAPVVTYSDIYAGWSGTGNINSNPEFRNRVAGDLHLMSTQYGYQYDSPCIDVGAPYIRDITLDSLWGLGTILSDMGAFGGGDFALADIEDERPVQQPSVISLHGNYPNPFNSQTSISFTLNEPSDILVEITDILGRKVERLTGSFQNAGRHSISWDAAGRSGGIYLYSIKTGGFSCSGKMLYLK